MAHRERAGRNRTLTLTPEERRRLAGRPIRLEGHASVETVLNKTICQDALEALPLLPDGFVDILFLDPPYNMDKTWSGASFKRLRDGEYAEWLDSWLAGALHVLKGTASVYICGDWRNCSAVYRVARKHFTVRNRITWERDKGRGAKWNWKNNSEDIWFCTVSDEFFFNAKAVKLKRKVLAPYRDVMGRPKDWQRTGTGDHRLTHPANIWTDITVPFWSMPENTDHPTQKPEKLLAKVILASSREDDVVLDPFLGSGTTSVVAKKLHRRYVGIEIDEGYCCLAEKRLQLADSDTTIQGYSDGVFWERNSAPPGGNRAGKQAHGAVRSLFGESDNAQFDL